MLLFALVSSEGLRAQPAVVFLKNGDRISGTIISENTNQITLSNLWSKEIIIPLAEVIERLKGVDVDPSRRAETLTLAEWAKIQLALN